MPLPKSRSRPEKTYAPQPDRPGRPTGRGGWRRQILRPCVGPQISPAIRRAWPGMVSRAPHATSQTHRLRSLLLRPVRTERKKACLACANRTGLWTLVANHFPDCVGPLPPSGKAARPCPQSWQRRGGKYPACFRLSSLSGW